MSNRNDQKKHGGRSPRAKEFLELELLPNDVHFGRLAWDGIAVRTMPSLTGTDAWHYDKGYAGRPMGE